MPPKTDPPPYRQWLHQALWDWLPPHCLLCRTRCRSHVNLCDHCLGDVTAIQSTRMRCKTPLDAIPVQRTDWPVGIDRLYCGLRYTGPVRELIHAWKFRKTPSLTALLLGLAWNNGAAPPADYDGIVPIPMHWRRKLVRGFNQSHLLALAVSQRWATDGRGQVPINALLSVERRRKAQHTLNRRQRMAHAAADFKLCREITQRRILLVDDVVTTGATLASAAQTLKAAGVGRIDAWCLARTL